MNRNLDAIDLQILHLLQQNGRMTQVEIAKAVELTPASVLPRIRRLEESGLIKDYHARLDRQMMGFGLMVFVQVQLALHQDRAIEHFRRAVKAMDEVLECHHVSGDFDYLLKVTVKNMSAYEKFVREKLSAVRGVGKIQSCFVMNTAKETTVLPIGEVWE